MTEQDPHPSDYMTDQAYEQFLRDGGVSAVTLEIDLQDERYDPDDNIVVSQFTGDFDMLPTAVLTALDEALTLPSELNDGDWLVVVDSKLVSVGELPPVRIEAVAHR